MLFLYATVQSFVAEAKNRRNETGATAVEYGLLVGLIAITMIVGVTLVGDNLLAMFNSIGGELAPVAPAP